MNELSAAFLSNSQKIKNENDQVESNLKQVQNNEEELTTHQSSSSSHTITEIDEDSLIEYSYSKLKKSARRHNHNHQKQQQQQPFSKIIEIETTSEEIASTTAMNVETVKQQHVFKALMIENFIEEPSLEDE